MAAAAALLLGGHTPYRQWVVYRRKHLLIGCHRADPRTYELAQRAVLQLVQHLPSSRARVARAPNAGRLASLLGTEQMEVAILSPADAAAMVSGAGGFEPYGPIALRLLTPIADRLLVSRAEFPARHAWLVAGALVGTPLALAPAPEIDHGVPWHVGSRAFLNDEPEPSGEPEAVHE
ncbi:MAG: hypothetical protein ACRED5_12345 [Propylenella sp.]